jgi:hypothetical protein
MPGRHVEAGSVRARWLIAVRYGCLVLKVSAFVVRRDMSANADFNKMILCALRVVTGN